MKNLAFSNVDDRKKNCVWYCDVGLNLGCCSQWSSSSQRPPTVLYSRSQPLHFPGAQDSLSAS